MNKRMHGMAALLLALIMFAAAAVAESVSDPQRLDICYSLSLSYMNRQEYDKALEYLNTALSYCDEETDPVLHADIYTKIGWIHSMDADYAAAIAALDEAIRIQPDQSDAYLVRANICSETEDYAAAAENLEKYIEITGDADVYETLAQFYSQMGDADKALESYRAYLDANHVEGAESAYTMGVYKQENGQYEAAIADFEACLGDADYGPSAMYNIGICHMRVEDYESALTALQSCVENGVQVDGLQYNIGICQMMTDHYPEAIEAFTASIDSESYRDDALYNRAVCYVKDEKYEMAAEDFTVYLQGLAELPAAADGEQPESDDAGEAQPVEPVNIATYYRGVCYMSLNEYEKAVADFTACLENGVSPESSLFNRGLCLLQDGQYESARADLTACIEGGSSEDEALYYRSYVYRYLGDNEAALADLTACIEHGYNLGQSYYQRAQVYNDMNDEAHYIEDLEEALNH